MKTERSASKLQNDRFKATRPLHGQIIKLKHPHVKLMIGVVPCLGQLPVREYPLETS